MLVSACLTGQKIRYDGGCNRIENDRLFELANQSRIIAVCPETAGGLPVPRAPAEIIGPGGGEAVLNKRARVYTIEGRDVTRYFLAGAEIALSIAIENRIKVALLKEISPSCGVTAIYDGTFTRARIKGSGVTAALLKRNGVTVLDESDVDTAVRILNGVKRGVDP